MVIGYEAKVEKYLSDNGNVEDGHSCERLYNAMIRIGKGNLIISKMKV